MGFKEVLKSYEIPGCLASMEDEMMDLLISQKGKRLLNTVNQFLNDITLAKGSPKLRTPTRISGHSLEKLLSKIQSTNSIDSMTIHTEKLQVIFNFHFFEQWTNPKATSFHFEI